MHIKRGFSVLLGLFLVLDLCLGSSLWSKDSASPIVKKSKFKIGDTITVIIDENLNAAQSGTTKSDKNTQVGFAFDGRSSATNQPRSTGRSNTYKSSDESRLALTTGGNDTYTGTGRTTRQTNIKTTITATVIDIQPNGNLFILGQREIKVNNETEQLEISGLVSPEKLSDDNSIYSTQIANAKITVKGSGVVSGAQQPGILNRMFEWLF